jgi:hypothetical protein
VNARPPGEPKQGIYRDATLGVIENRVMTAIDTTTSKRRRNRWLGVGALALLALGGTSAASALGFRLEEATSVAGEPGEAWQVMCVDGDGAYYGVRFRVAEAADAHAIDVEQLCSTAWQQASAGALDAESTNDLSDLVDGMLVAQLTRQGLDPADYEVETGYTARVETAENNPVPAMATCVDQDVPRSLYVVTSTASCDISETVSQQ